jgi:2-dehydro-3-deoxyglucarate aldolase/4-hydroxy-2-oxoheptanedioate aldolase
VRAFTKLGYDFVAIAGDVWLLQQAFAAGVATVRQGLAHSE